MPMIVWELVGILQATSAIRICLAYWILSKSSQLTHDDLDVVETVLGTQKGAVFLVLQKCSLGLQEAARQIRNSLYDGLFNYLLNQANKSAQVRESVTLLFTNIYGELHHCSSQILPSCICCTVVGGSAASISVICAQKPVSFASQNTSGHN